MPRIKLSDLSIAARRALATMMSISRASEGVSAVGIDPDNIPYLISASSIVCPYCGASRAHDIAEYIGDGEDERQCGECDRTFWIAWSRHIKIKNYRGADPEHDTELDA